MRVLLVNPCLPDVFPHVGIAHLQGALLAAGIDCMACDANRLPYIINSRSFEFDVIGISVHSFAVSRALHCAKICHYAWPHARVVAGGHHATAMPGQMLAGKFTDVISGQGEKQLVEMCGGVYSGYTYPVYTGLETTGGHIPFLGPTFPIITSFGCPFSCSFCASSAFWGSKWTARPAESVIHEIEFRRKSGQMNTWMFEDDNFTADRYRAIEICQGISAVAPGVPWACAGRASDLTDSVLCLALKNAGCVRVWLGVESFSDRMLGAMNKGATAARMQHGIGMAEAFGLPTFGQFIIGFPGENEDSITQTVNGIKLSKLTNHGGNICWVLPGTKPHAEATARGFKDRDYVTDGAPFYTFEQPISVLNEWNRRITEARNG